MKQDSAALLARGNGRSYGDVCLNSEGKLIDTRFLDRLLSADWDTGIVRVGSGLTYEALLEISVPRGWFPAVCPGTKFVTIGGAIANDVHGKNHEAAGSIGLHVRALAIARSDGSVLEVSTEKNASLFAATIGGLGLTGIILWAELQLRQIKSSFFDVQIIKLRGLPDFFDVADQSTDWEYTAAWLDCIAGGSKQGRGIFIRGNHSEQGGLSIHRTSRLNVPANAPEFLLNVPAMRLFNLFEWTRHSSNETDSLHYDEFLFPLDKLLSWNKLYGKRGFFQHQSVIPDGAALQTIDQLLKLASLRKQPCFFAVMKRLGKKVSPGILSFPRAGVTIALDFPNRGAETVNLLHEMYDIVVAAGGRIYPAKDSCMTPRHFQQSFPDWKAVCDFKDPQISSNFWRRVTAISQ